MYFRSANHQSHVSYGRMRTGHNRRITSAVHTAGSEQDRFQPGSITGEKSLADDGTHWPSSSFTGSVDISTRDPHIQFPVGSFGDSIGASFLVNHDYQDRPTFSNFASAGRRSSSARAAAPILVPQDATRNTTLTSPNGQSGFWLFKWTGGCRRLVLFST